MTSWFDYGVTLRAYVSTAGDFVALGNTTKYPFMPSGAGYPAGWTQYLSGGGVASDVSWNTDGTTGRFSVGNLGTDVHTNKYYGIYRDFPATPGKRYLLRVQCRTTAERSTAIRYVNYRRNGVLQTATQVWSFPDWEQVVLYTGVVPAGTTTVGIHMYAAPYTASTHHAPADANWGIQFQNPAIVEMEGTYPAPTWSEMTCDVRNATIHHGRDKFTSRYDVATCQVDLQNDDGQWNYAAADSTNATLRPGRFIKIVGQRPGTGITQNLFYGLIDSIGESYTIDGRAYTQFNCIDVSTLLANSTVASYHDQYDLIASGARFRALVYQSGWLPQMMAADTGQFNMQAVLANGRSVRDEMGLIADSEGGYFFADTNGYLIFRDRTWDAFANTTVNAELIAKRDPTFLPAVDTVPNRNDGFLAVVPLQDVRTEWSRDRVVNELQLANEGGTAIVTTDPVSKTKYGPRTYQRLDFLNANDYPEYLTIRTQDLMTGYTDAILRVNQVSFRPMDSLGYYFALTLRFGALVRVRYEHPTQRWGYAVVSRIQGWTHSITPNDWVVTLNVDQPISFVPYTYSNIGWDFAKWDTDVWDNPPDTLGEGT